MVKVAKLHTKWYRVVFFLFRWVEKESKKYTNEREKKSSFFIEKKKKKEESKFFTRTLSHKESLCLCVSVSLSRVRVRERKRESNVGRRVRRRDRCVALFYRGGFPGEQSWFRKRLKVKSRRFSPLLFFSLSLD